jgi:serine/threonine protein kinase
MSNPGVIIGGRWKLVERIAEGRFAEVWRGVFVDEDVPVAVKVATSDLGARMLRAEAEIADRLDGVRHTVGVVRVHAFVEGERPALVMRWIAGGTFRGVVDAIRTSDDRARAVGQFFDLVATVARIHAQAIAHGDLKPENVLMDGRAGPLLTDFGFARELARERLSSSLRHSMSGTADGIAGGTLAYMPPEAVKGAEPSPKGDVYALGVMLHELLLGRRPDKAAGPEVLKKLLREDVVDALTRALAFDPADRTPDARAFLRDLEPARRALTRTGAARMVEGARGLALAALAAFFVALRYASVLALLSGYTALLVCGLLIHPGILVGFLPIFLLHAVIRWEGPETEVEARLRRTGAVR